MTFLKAVSHCPEVDTRWTHEYVPSTAPSGIFWHAKDFPMSPEVDAIAGEIQPGFIRWLPMHSRMSQCFYDVFIDVFMITSELWESVRPA